MKVQFIRGHLLSSFLDAMKVMSYMLRIGHARLIHGCLMTNTDTDQCQAYGETIAFEYLLTDNRIYTDSGTIARLVDNIYENSRTTPSEYQKHYIFPIIN